MKNLGNKKYLYLNAFVFTCIAFFFLLLHTVNAQTLPPFKPLVGIPGLSNSGASTLPDYINKVYILIITIGALFGVVKIAIAGVKYSMSDVVTNKSDAKKDIYNVLLGLAILLLPFVVLNTINPNLTRLDVLKEAPKINLNQSVNTTNTSRPGINTGEGQTSVQMADEAVSDMKITTRTERYSLTPIFDPSCPSCYNIVDYDDSNARAQCSARNGAFTTIGASQGECVYADASYGNDGNQGMPQ